MEQRAITCKLATFYFETAYFSKTLISHKKIFVVRLTLPNIVNFDTIQDRPSKSEKQKNKGEK